MFCNSHISESDSSDEEEDVVEEVVNVNSQSINVSKEGEKDSSGLKLKIDRKRRGSVENGVRMRQRLESTSLVTTPVTDDNLVDYHEHHLSKEQDPFDLKYRLYAVVVRIVIEV